MELAHFQPDKKQVFCFLENHGVQARWHLRL